jgi:sulfofructose kinase
LPKKESMSARYAVSPGLASSSDAILVDPAGERLICAFTDPALDPDPSWLPLASVAQLDAVMADVRWPAGAAASSTRPPHWAFRRSSTATSVRPRRFSISRSARRMSFLSSPVSPMRQGPGAPGVALARIAGTLRGVVGVTLGAEGFLWRDGQVERRVARTARCRNRHARAGDVWHAPSRSGLGEKMPVPEAARFANTAAA